MSDDRDPEVIRDLTASVPDYMAATLRILASSAGPAGALIAEIFTTGISRQRNEQFRDFLFKLSALVNGLRVDLDAIRNDPERVELIAQGTEAAARAAREDRRKYIAELVARGITTEEQTAGEAKKLLNTLNALSDAEIIFLIDLSLVATPERRKAFRALNCEVLDLAGEEVGSPQPVRDRRGLQEGYMKNLERLGLVHDPLIPGPGSRSVSGLGLVFLRYIGVDDREWRAAEPAVRTPNNESRHLRAHVGDGPGALAPGPRSTTRRVATEPCGGYPASAWPRS